MKNLKTKLILLTIVLFAIIILPKSIYASNENLEILINKNEDGIIYIKNHLNEEFQFSFSNEENETNLSYKNSETDSEGNHIAYINDEVRTNYFTDPTVPVYFWAKDENGTLFAEKVQIDLESAISNKKIEEADKITTIIHTNITKYTTEEIVGKTKKTTSVGKIEIVDKGKYEYQLIGPNAEEYKELIILTERMSKINSVNDAYTELKTYREFINLYEGLFKGLKSEDWKTVSNNEILQPEEAKTGDVYVLWLINTETQEYDFQILTSIREESQEVIKEMVTTKSPVTYDNNTLLVVLGILIIAIIAVSLRIRILKYKKEEK